MSREVEVPRAESVDFPQQRRRSWSEGRGLRAQAVRAAEALVAARQALDASMRFQWARGRRRARPPAGDCSA